MKFEPLLDGPGGTQFAVAPDSIAMTEVVGELTGTAPDLDPDDPAVGSIAKWTLTGNSTPVDTLTDGQSMTLHLTPGAYSVTWPTSTIIGDWPTGLAAGLNVIVLWKVGTTLFRLYSGDSA